MRNKKFKNLKEFYNFLINEEENVNLPKDRLNIYRKLIFYNIEDTCAKAFPISKSLIGQHWENLVEDFIKNYKLSTHYLWQVPKFFIDYLNKIGFFEGKEFLKDLMVYEWIEIEIFNEDLPKFKQNFNWYNTYRISNSARLLNLKYPIHKINKINISQIENSKGSFYLIIFQNPENHEVEYIEITKFLFDVLSNICNNNLISTVKEICKIYKVDFEDLHYKLEGFFQMLIENKILC